MTDIYVCLSLTAQPTIESLPGPMNLTEGDRFELVCTFTGIPAPEIRREEDESVFLLGEGTVLEGHSWRSIV